MKTVTIPAEAVGYFRYDFAAGSTDERYGALCALGLQEEARAWRLLSDERDMLTEQRAREQEPADPNTFFGSLEFKPHPLDAQISAVEERISQVSRVIMAAIDAALDQYRSQP